MENSTRTYPRARDPQNGVQEDERGAPTARPPAPPGEAAHDGALRKGISERTIVCRLRACAPECALTVPAWRVQTLLYKHAYIYSPVDGGRGCISTKFGYVPGYIVRSSDGSLRLQSCRYVAAEGQTDASPGR